MSVLFSRTDQSVLSRWWWTVDRSLLAAFLALIAFGIVLVAAASPPVAERIGVGEYHFIKRHLFILVPAVTIMFGMSFLSPRDVWRVASLVLVASLLGMILVLFSGTEIKGAHRWINLFGFSLQPSEFMKPAFAIVAGWLVARQKEIASFPGNKIALGLFGFTLALLIAQPDFGMSVVTACIYGAILFLAGLRLLFVAGLALIGIGGVVAGYFFLDHVHKRFNDFFDLSGGDGYQVEKSLEAFRHGGIFGTGPGQGTVKLNLPDAHADFIFSVAGEELGLLFVAFLILIFCFVLLRGFNRLSEGTDMFVIFAVGGILTMFGAQSLIHMGSSVHLLPAKGMTLPFISYGGSSLLAISWAMGAVLALTRRQGRATIARGSALTKRAYGSGKA